MSVRVRYAPSPTGRLHIGNMRPALLNWYFALKHGGDYVLRHDDTDMQRSTREFADLIEADLAWLGILPGMIVRQSERTDLYDAARDRLIASGRLYPCYETEDELDRRRKRARALGRPPIYDRAALQLTDEDRQKLEAEGRRPHWRFRLDGKPVVFSDLIRAEQTVNTATMSDPVLVREDGSYLYTLPSVVDDIDLGITHVIRGEDHISNTGVQIEIIEALGGAVPQFAHHNLLTGASGEGLSKRLGSLAVSQLRADGYEPLAVAILASLTGTSLSVEPYLDLAAIAEALEFESISHGPARFDPAELDGLNARILHEMDYATAQPRLAALGFDNEPLWSAVHQNLQRFDDIKAWAEIVEGPIDPDFDAEDEEFLRTAAEALPPEPWDETTWGAWTSQLKQQTGRKGKALFMPLRRALTGRTDGPELKSLLPLIGRKASVDRLP
ncbi:glutamate--tRNA ligase [Devosia pacifica]|uniref:Glutamate--tRNA ligase n=1 Tax=Devosia pacifica TaxID=1335967 RepID=A0A918S8L4_9HYPH|nr:glutamate--tRNA ligase [Devosia pacifica]GHA28941.1 glutamate--tRNA ligase [Devosia pacifica]